MKGSARPANANRLAFGPAVLLILCAMPAFAIDAKPRDVYSKVTSEEARIVTALKARDSVRLQRSVGALGKLIDDALARRDRGEAVTPCDMAAHSLAFVAMSAAEALAHQDQEKKILLADALSAAEDFRKDIQACETLAGRKFGSHANVGKALRAL